MVAVGTDPPPHARLARPLVLYKGSCPFCRASARLIERLDRDQRLALLPFDDADAAAFLAPYSEEERDESWHLFTPAGEHLIKGDATMALIEELAPLRSVGRAIRALRLTWLVHAFYWIVSHSRGQLSRFLSGEPGPRRFP
ncbi:MAG: DUF393 domain-containing protein [Actinomycetota bacterium]|nr:DUF393 domain-containing protein [Actinomycetota bacterium]